MSTPSRIRRRSGLLLALAACVVGVVAMVGPAPSDEYVIEIGPVSMPANGGHGDIAQPSPLALKLPVDGWLRGMAFELVDEKGRQLPRQMLHHLNIIAPERRELFSQIMLRIGAAGPETRPYRVPWFLGYRLHPGDSRPGDRDAAQSDAERAPWRPAAGPARAEPGSGLASASGGPSAVPGRDAAGGRACLRPAAWPLSEELGRAAAVAARLLAAGSHLHQYGTALRLEDVSSGKVIWEARPKLGDGGEVVGMPLKYFLPLRCRSGPRPPLPTDGRVQQSDWEGPGGRRHGRAGRDRAAGFRERMARRCAE